MLFAAGRIDAVVDGAESRLVAPQMPAHQQVKAAIGILEEVARMLLVLHLLQNRLGGGCVLQFRIAVGELGAQVGAAREFADEHLPRIAHQFRADVLVGLRVALDGAHMHAALVREGRGPHEWLPRRPQYAQLLPDLAGDAGEPGKGAFRQALVAHLELQIGEDGGQVNIAAALAYAVDGAVHLNHALLYGAECIGDCQAAVVVHMDAELCLRLRLAYLAHRLRQLGRHHAAVGVAEDDPGRAPLHSGGDGGQRIAGVAGEAVEEVLGVVEDRLAGGLLQVGDGLLDHREVALRGHSQRLLHMQVPALAEDAGDVGVRLHELAQEEVLAGLGVAPVGGAERGDL